ncbi:MAG: hypothetical protein A2854_04075 [Parcubacteria group bacterium RIFCSPHIGHO2_01_FULL_56_18]|nr:MAG: hypothetical protein A2854_04075 [Parcubacteria group bacterium RIFCSPHIGHO2_01_FULL_56_18]
MNLLAQIYPPEGTFVHNPRFHSTKPEITVTCGVPKDQNYTMRPIPYVTAENYVRILSQSSYLLAHYVIENKIIPLEIAPEDFMRATVEFELYYRNIAMTFHQRVEKGESFEMTLELTDFREIRRLTDFVLFTFKNKRTVISGEMSFAYVGNTA